MKPIHWQSDINCDVWKLMKFIVIDCLYKRKEKNNATVSVNSSEKNRKVLVDEELLIPTYDI